mmetsp:Transcript_8100/g.17348  ORF Transcript_8100/g.17348 Transcript_8100/m.17348 type:complete len:225 (-) Transcript_8100:186-860(-)
MALNAIALSYPALHIHDDSSSSNAAHDLSAYSTAVVHHSAATSAWVVPAWLQVVSHTVYNVPLVNRQANEIHHNHGHSNIRPMQSMCPHVPSWPRNGTSHRWGDLPHTPPHSLLAVFSLMLSTRPMIGPLNPFFSRGFSGVRGSSLGDGLNTDASLSAAASSLAPIFSFTLPPLFAASSTAAEVLAAAVLAAATTLSPALVVESTALAVAASTLLAALSAAVVA